MDCYTLNTVNGYRIFVNNDLFTRSEANCWLSILSCYVLFVLYCLRK